ncbi:MAG: LytTR family DNA-binding domain-containing protein [Chitinophagaceae bacterium]|jgi:two-component system LytT family response regulator|nr:LytTR family DNA-binding domain-containing protein [Chitinophagaceae bacterium]
MNIPLNVVIVEDEIRSRELLFNLLGQYCTDVKVTGMAATVEEAIGMINDRLPALVFLDIEMHAGTGFDVLMGVKQRNFQVIFTTAYDHYALQAIKFSAVDYLLKPIDVEELQAAVQKVQKRVQAQLSSQTLEALMQNLGKKNPDEFSITLSTSEGLEFVQLTAIIRLEASGPYTSFFLKDGRRIMVSRHMKEFEQMLGDYGFFRLHNSYMINLKAVQRMVKSDGGYAIMTDGAMVPISPKKKEEFLDLINRRMVS